MALVEATAEAAQGWAYPKKAKNLLDPWGRPYQYIYPAANGDCEVYSLGQNGKATSASSDPAVPHRFATRS
jgi:general secretion pathway protein G